MSASDVTIRGCSTRGELEQVVDLLDRAFTDTPREYFDRHVLRDPTLRPEDTRILVADGTLVSSVQIFPRTLWVDGRPVACGGIGNVATEPRARGQGLASRVMRDALDRLRERHFPMALLTTTRNAYYERFGFRTLVRSRVTIADVPGRPAPDVRAFRRDEDFAAVRRLYDDYNRTSSGPVVRDERYWIGQFDFCGEDAGKFLVLEDRGGIQAYVRAADSTGCLDILEFGARADIPAAFDRLLASLAACAPGVPIRMFLSEAEGAKIGLRRAYTTSMDTDLMVLALDETVRGLVETHLMKPNAITFWLSDFF